jgi:hypothetical protein
MTSLPTEFGTFRSIGDYLIWRSEGIGQDFRMPMCIEIIANERARNSWLFQTLVSGETDDIDRILARYKEHVSYWKIETKVVQGELQAFANALGKPYPLIAVRFNQLQAQRFTRR